MTTSDPYAAFATDAPEQDKLSRLAQLAMDLGTAESEVAQAAAVLKKAQERERELCQKLIPEAMDEVGLSEFKTKDGATIKVGESIRCSIPVANRPAAWKWLEDRGHGGLIKRNVVVAFNRDQEEEAEALTDELRGKFSDTKTERRVESSTMRAFVREQLDAGADFPMDLFGAEKIRVAKIKHKK